MKFKLKTIIGFFIIYSFLNANEIKIHKEIKKETYDYPALKRDDITKIVFDPSSKLFWKDDIEINNITKTWNNAKKFCKDLSLGGYNDWYLPSIKELESIVDYKRIPYAYKKGFIHRPDNLSWSSSAVLSTSNSAWFVNFRYGNSYYNLKNLRGYVRCVRQDSKKLNN